MAKIIYILHILALHWTFQFSSSVKQEYGVNSISSAFHCNMWHLVAIAHYTTFSPFYFFLLSFFRVNVG